MDYRLWSTLEIKLLTMGIMPKGRSPLACRIFCRRNGVKFPGKRQCDANERMIKDIEEKFSTKGHDMKKDTKKKTITMSVKDAKAEKKPSAGKAESERQYSFRTIAVEKIQDKNNIRTVNDISDLVASIEAHGIINPITVIENGMPNAYLVVAGFRRLAAARKLGLKKVPCHVIQKGDEVREIALSENVNRINMTPYEECKAVKNLVNKKNTVQQIARKFGRTVRWVLVRKKLADAGEEILEKVKDGFIGLDAAAKLADLPDDVFKEEMKNCYRTDDYFVKNVLDRYHKDLNNAPFDHEACLKCGKCSACQKDLFENEPKAYCLDPDCWALMMHDFAKKKVEDLKAKGANARIGYFESFGIIYEDEAHDYEIRSWQTSEIQKAKDVGIEQRVLVNPDTGKVFKYYDRRDLPDFVEESEEEREERVNAEREENHKNEIRDRIYSERLRKRIASCVFNFQSQADRIVALLVYVADNNYDFFEDKGKEILGIKCEDDDYKGIDDMPKDKTFRAIADAVRCSGETIMNTVRNVKDLLFLCRILGIANPEKEMPSDEDVEEEIAKRNAENNDEQDDDEDDEEWKSGKCIDDEDTEDLED